MVKNFSFGFSNDDIEDAADYEQPMDVGKPPSTLEAAEHAKSTLVEPRRHTLQELLSTLPSKISYTTLRITATHGRSITLARRELFDIRAQIMAEDSGEDSTLIAGLSADDVTPSVYEGGFKTWECAVDLARLLLEEYGEEEGVRWEGCHVVELGAGTALPTLTLLRLTLAHPSSHPVRFTLADYNAHVLRLATIPNLLLTWASHTGLLEASDGDLDITPELLEDFLQDLQSRNIFFDAISGAWGPELTRLVKEQNAFCGDGSVLVLASETIYSPTSIGVFTETLLELLSLPPGSNPPAPGSTANPAVSPAATTRALVAAKRVYFGVGGGVDEFLTVLSSTDGVAREVWATEGEGAGVGRVVLEVRRELRG
ncbi:MAG: hypothetical protein LQ347_002001 [Umbilicaria vellea]|nr:MAG: hypothetical protein LQ347_002001 [Umbilicaria vellea]